MRQPITEKDNVYEEWYETAKNMTLAELPEFLRHLAEDYKHDYGTICHAHAAGAIATAWAINHTEQGGITGFQAGSIMWEFVTHWIRIKPPLALLEYRDMLYPQYEERFTTISRSAWNILQSEAKEKLESEEMSPDVEQHMRQIADGVVPFGYSVRDD
ncbi:hypothetical protein CW696_08440 [ANME-2 cluster archaeon]|nr:MAG: hypothetical protein CW696_08440 [ANME-2 cluster archaeon]